MEKSFGAAKKPEKAEKTQAAKILVVLAVAAVLLSFFAGCSASTLLYGVWQDPNGNVLELHDDSTFLSKISVAGVSEELEGTWVWPEGSNTINFHVATADGVEVYTQDGGEVVLLSFFEINGGILKITWATDAVNTELLRLQKTE